ncbi:Apoptosis inhibitor 5 [Sparganum proliferum]
MGEVIGVDALYRCFDVISSDSTDEPKKLEAFTTILSGTKGGDKEKRLSSQFIGRFFKRFKDLEEDSFNCLLDLCDDPDVAIRKQAVQDLQSICKHEPAFTSRVADVLVQMLATDDHSESHIVALALSGLLLADPRSTLTGIFNQMLADNSGSPRDHVLRFLAESLKRLPKETLDDQLEEFILEQTNKVLLDVSENEFILLITVLSSLKCMSTVPGRQKLVNMITTQVVQAVPSFDPQDASCLAQKNVTAGAFLNSDLDRRGILRVLTEFSMHPGDVLLSCSETEKAQILCPLYALLLNSLPNIPEDPLLALPSAAESGGESGQSTKNLIPDQVSCLNILEIECLLFSIVNLSRLLPNFLDFTESSGEDSTGNSEAASRVRCLRPKLQYLARLIQLYRRNILSSTEELLKMEEISHESASDEAKQALSNVEALVRLFFRNRPTLDISTMVPSWKKIPGAVKPGDKRPPIPPADQSTETGKTGRIEHTYRMPAGRWSGGRSGARGGFRGRRFPGNSRPGRGRMY